MKRTKTTNILLIISAIITLGIIFNLIYLCNHQNHLDYWTIFWTCIAAIAVPVSIFGYILEDKKASSAKYNEAIKEIMTEIYPNFISAYELFSSKHISNDKLKISNDELEFYNLGYKILSKIDLFGDETSFKNDGIKEYRMFVIEKLMPYSSNLLKVYAGDPLIFQIFDSSNNPNVYNSNESEELNNEELNNIDKNTSEKFSNIDKDTNYISLILPSVFSKADTVVIVKTHGNNKESVAGDWKISEFRAKHMTHVIGIEIKDDGSKSYIGTYKIEKSIQVPGNRYRFKLDNSQIVLDEKFKTDLLEKLKIWTSANPVRYLDGLIDNN